MMEIPENLMDSLSHILPRRPQLIADINAYMGLGTAVRPDWISKYPFHHISSYRKKADVDPQVNLSASYSLADDITQSDVNISRSILDVYCGNQYYFFLKI
jgi:hypothetical protein